MSTAQAAFDTMVRDGLRPRLRAAGFKGSGTTFVVPSDAHHGMIGLQKSYHSNRNRVIFTANVTVVGKAEWDAARAQSPWLPKKPAPNTRYGRETWQQRIGLLLPDGKDLWWEVAARGDWLPVANEVIECIQTYALPAIRSRMDSQRPT